MFHVRFCDAVLSVSCSLVITCWESADLLALLCVVFSCVLSLSHMVSRVRCGTVVVVDLLFIVGPIFVDFLFLFLVLKCSTLCLSSLQLSWCGRESWLLGLSCLPGVL